MVAPDLLAMLSRISKFILVFVLSLTFIAPVVHAESKSTPVIDWSVSKVRFSKEIKITPVTESLTEAKDILQLTPDMIVEVNSVIPKELIQRNHLTSVEVSRMNAFRRDVLVGTMRGLMADDFSGVMISSLEEGVALYPGAAGYSASTVNPFKFALGFERAITLQNVKRVAIAVNEVIILSFFRGSWQWIQGVWKLTPKANEFGVSFNLKIERQYGIGGFSNSAKNIAHRFDIGFKPSTMEFTFRTGSRRETIGGGVSAPNVKIEVRLYEANTDDQKTIRSTGHTFYPISPPAVSLVFDSSARYAAMGVLLSVNPLDWVGGSFTNAINNFEEEEMRFTFTEVQQSAFDKLKRLGRRILFRPPSCQAIFG